MKRFPRLQKLGVATIVSVLLSVIRWAISDYGYLQTAHDLFEQRTAIIRWFGKTLLWAPLGPLVAVGCLVAYVVLEWRKRHDPKGAEELGRPPAGLIVMIGDPMVSPGDLLPSDNTKREAALSLRVRVINRSGRKASVTLHLADSDLKVRLRNATPFELQFRNLITRKGWVELFSPVAVDVDQEIAGYMWFFAATPKQLPLKEVLVSEAISGHAWLIPLHEDLAPKLKGIEHYNATDFPIFCRQI